MNTASNNWHNIPPEFRGGAWAVASMQPVEYKDRDGSVYFKPDKSPRHPADGRRLSVSEPAAWATFAEACDAAASRPGWQIGRLLWAGDGFVVLDLDDISDDKRIPPAARANYAALQLRLIDEGFPPSYAEVSASGRGLHVIYRANLERGRRPSDEDSQMVGAELYGHARFMVTTGNVWRNLLVAEAQSNVDKMVEAMDKAGGTAAFTDDELSGRHLTPSQVFDRMVARRRRRDEFLSLHRKGYASLYAREFGDNRNAVDMSWAHLVAHAEPSFAAFLELFRQSALWRVNADGSVDKAGYRSERVYIGNYVYRTWLTAAGTRAALKQHAAMMAEQGRRLAARMTVNGKRAGEF